MTKQTYYVPCGAAGDHTRIEDVRHYLDCYGVFLHPDEAYRAAHGSGYVMKVEISMMTPVVTFKDGTWQDDESGTRKPETVGR